MLHIEDARRRTTRTMLAPLICSAAALLGSACGSATAVEEIEPGTTVTIKLEDGQIVRGQMLEVQPSTFVIKSALDGRASTIQRTSVVEVEPEPEVAGDEARASEPVFDDIVLGAGTELSVELETALVSNASRIEDRVFATMSAPVVVDGTEVIPAGARVTGVVTNAKASGKVQGRASLAFSFDEVNSGDSSYQIETKPFVYHARATKKEDATKIGVGAAAGSLIGAVAGGKKGAAVGAAVGGGAGTAVVLSTSGEEVRVPAGTSLSVRLTSPVTIRVQRSAS